jgi:acetyl-CoA carboxylase biotin carboxyl carrier protein
MIDLRYVKKLIEMIDESSVDSIEITSDKGMKIRISKSPNQRGTVQVAAPMAMPAMVPSAAAPRLSPAQGMPAVTDADVAAAPAAEAPKKAGLDVKSPMVGTFYASPEPGAKAYVSVGDRVAKGQIVCIIEAMKIMNEIESEYAGVVKEVLVQDAQPVEYGQVLFTIDPNG